jgi:hypothetical protein
LRGRADAARVLGSWASAAAPSTDFDNGAAPRCWHCVNPYLRRSPSSSHFYNLARSCADSNWRSSLHQGRGSLFRHTGCTTRLPGRYQICGLGRPHGAFARRPARCSVITQRARMQQRPSSATASVSACAAPCFVARVRADRAEKTPSPTPAESHVAESACRRRAKRPSI